MSIDSLLILVGAFVGGFVSGLTGFGTGLTALAFWLHAIGPALAAPLVVVCSVVAHIQTLPAIWHAIDVKRIAPFIAGGVIGVPFGVVLLGYVTGAAFKLAVGVLLVAYCGALLLTRVRLQIAWGGRVADGLVGLGGGVLGGLAGLAGPLPTIWSNVRGWGKYEGRGMFQPFNFIILTLAFAGQFATGYITLEFGQLVLIALPGTVLGAWLGRRVYDRIEVQQFDQVVLSLLLLSGVSLILGSI
jgi:uncharacterized membrane protein YfcA